MKRIFIKDIRDGDIVKDIFLVRRKSKGIARNGKPYLNITLADKEGDMEARVWENAQEMDKMFETGSFVRVDARGNLYQNKVQLNVLGLTKVDEKDLDLSDFLKASSKQPDELIEELRGIYSKLDNKYLKKLIFAFLEDDEFLAALKRAPAAKTVHHAYLGGLIEHIASLSVLAQKIADHYPQLNRDLLLAAAFFHDIGKVREIGAENNFEYTNEGKLIGHLVLGIEMIHEGSRKIEGFPKELLVLLKHMIVSHHGTLEFGSPKVPQVLEALIFHYLDDIDAKINTVSELLEGKGVSEWSEFSRFMGREFFKPELSTASNEEKTVVKPKASSKKPSKSKKKKKSQTELELFK